MATVKKKNEYQFNSNEFIKIWFSKNQDVFLPMVNQVRFINFILDHPGSKVHFIYKSSLLSDFAKNELTSFCKKFNVIAVDFDSVKTITKIDQQLKQLVNVEIDHAIKDQGGDLGAASDMARLIPNIIKLGFYLDFDTKAKFEQKSYTAKTAFIADIRGELLPNGGIYVTTNNQFVAIAKLNDGTMHKNAALVLEELSKRIIDKYSGFQKVNPKSVNDQTWSKLSKIFSIDLLYDENKLKTQQASTDNIKMKYLLLKYFESSYCQDPSIFSLRHFVRDAIKNTDVISDTKQFIYDESVRYGFNPKIMKASLTSFDLTTQNVYEPLVMAITGPEVLREYMTSKGQQNFILDQNLSNSISTQDEKVEITPDKTIDRDGDISWFVDINPNQLFLTEDRSKIFEIEELEALRSKIDKIEYADPLADVLQEYFILGCKEINYGYTGICKRSESADVLANNNHLAEDSLLTFTKKIICNYMGLSCTSEVQDF